MVVVLWQADIFSYTMPTSVGYNPPGGGRYYEIYEEGEVLPLLTWIFVPLSRGTSIQSGEYFYTTFQIPTEVGHPNIQVGECWEVKDKVRLGFIPSQLVGELGDIVQLVFCDRAPVADDVIGVWLFALP